MLGVCWKRTARKIRFETTYRLSCKAPGMFRRSAQQTADRSDVERLALFTNTKYSPGDALEFEKEALTRDFLVGAGVTWDNVAAAKMDVATLKEAHGFASLDDLKRLHLDALELTDADLMQQVINAYGVEEVRRLFASEPADLATLIGSEGGRVLNISISVAMDACAGCPTHAAAAIRRAGTLVEVIPQLTIDQLLNSGLRRVGLINLGLTSTMLINYLPTAPSPKQIRELGIEPRIL